MKSNTAKYSLGFLLAVCVLGWRSQPLGNTDTDKAPKAQERAVRPDRVCVPVTAVLQPCTSSAAPLPAAPEAWLPSGSKKVVPPLPTGTVPEETYQKRQLRPKAS